ncbi:uncharacterized protein LOC124434102 [Xenia sp. Carnegie-2017]|uniref:uncharacterized protein LOC124434102 n=1 Tax=Xenia sp. Carnegie-2017 TaxID=2897299 RepID=UPI001F04031C|nr:uncharacterized protein LOC124434102 [Xenia sp. Carnegie-2017]
MSTGLRFKCSVILLVFMSILTDSIRGATQCGWIFRNNLITPSLSIFDSSYNLTVIPVIFGQAWCLPVNNHSLTVNLGSVTNVTKLAVQGQERTENYVTAYEVDYSIDGQVFKNIRNGLRPQCSAREFFGPFPGKSTGSDIAESNISRPFLAQYVRFRPQESVGNLCTRIDIYGCQSGKKERLLMFYMGNLCTRVDIYGCQSDNGFTSWTQWSACFSTSSTSTNCGRTRRRNCEKPLEGCKGNRNETQECLTQQCPVVCGELGIVDDNRAINNSAFQASTFKPGFEPFKARLNGLGGETRVTEIATQGLENGTNSSWVTRFFIDFRRSDNSLWQDYTINGSVRIFEGNVNAMIVRRHTLERRSSFRYIRFYPLEWNNHICMRVSVTGCRDTPLDAPPIIARSDDDDDDYWILLWVVLGLLLLLLLLGLLYLCCRYCPCCACCPCGKQRKKKSKDDMRTVLTTDETDAPPKSNVRYATEGTQTDTARQTGSSQSISLNIDEGERGGTFKHDAYGARYNEGMQRHEDETRIAGSSAFRDQSTDSRRNVITSKSRDIVDGSQRTEIAHEESSGRSDSKIMTSSQYEREKFQSSERGREGGERYEDRYDVSITPGAHRHPVADLETSQKTHDGTWRVETLDEVNGRMSSERRYRDEAELDYQGISYRGHGYRGHGYRSHGAERSMNIRESSDARRGGIVVRLAAGDDYNGMLSTAETDTSTAAEYTVHLHDYPPAAVARLQANETQSLQERYFEEETLRAGSRSRHARAESSGEEVEVENWKLTSIRGEAFKGDIYGDSSSEHGSLHTFHLEAPPSFHLEGPPLSPSSSDITSISQYGGSSIGDQYTEERRKKESYKMFDYSRD